MRKVLLLFCIILIMVANVGCSFRKKTITFRPVNLYIYDEKTKEPLKGITVKVSNAIYHNIPFKLDNYYRKTYLPLENFETNEEGYVQISEYAYKVKRKYYLDGQSILINIETINEEWRNDGDAYSSAYFYKRENEHYQRLINKYKAVQIKTCMSFKPTDEEYIRKNLEWSTPFIRSFYICSDLKDLNCGTEVIKIYLEHFVEPRSAEACNKK